MPIDPNGLDLLACYWGKASPSVSLGAHDHHTVMGHSLDVAACAFVLIDRNPALRAQLTTATAITVDAVAITFAGVCAIHDIGKFDTRFQRKAPHVADALRPRSAVVDQCPYDHGTEGFRQIEDDDAERGHLCTLLGPSGLPLLRAVCGHHGVLPSREEPNPNRTRVPDPLRREDVLARRLFQDCVVEFFVGRGATLPWTSTVDGAVVQRVSGLCAVADWLGSNVDHFPYAPGSITDLDGYWKRACERAGEACTQAGLLRAPSAPIGFGALFPGYSPRDVQTLTEQVVLDEPALVAHSGQRDRSVRAS